MDALLGPGLVECHIDLADKLHVLVQVSCPDRSNQYVLVGMPQQQPVGADDGRVQVAWSSLVEGEWDAVDGVAEVIDKV